MADGCHMTLDANTQWTQRMTRMAHIRGVAVEAELGKLVRVPALVRAIVYADVSQPAPS